MSQAERLIPQLGSDDTPKSSPDILEGIQKATSRDDTPKSIPPKMGGIQKATSHVKSGGGGRVDTVWTTDAAKRIALSSGTEAGVRYANELVELEHRHGAGNADFIEHLAEIGNGGIAPLPKLPVPCGTKRVEDAIQDHGGTATHKQACIIGKMSKRVSDERGVKPAKVNSSKYPNAYVNAYAEDIIDMITGDVLDKPDSV